MTRGLYKFLDTAYPTESLYSWDCQRVIKHQILRVGKGRYCKTGERTFPPTSTPTGTCTSMFRGVNPGIRSKKLIRS